MAELQKSRKYKMCKTCNYPVRPEHLIELKREKICIHCLNRRLKVMTPDIPLQCTAFTHPEFYPERKTKKIWCIHDDLDKWNKEYETLRNQDSKPEPTTITNEPETKQEE